MRCVPRLLCICAGAISCATLTSCQSPAPPRPSVSVHAKSSASGGQQTPLEVFQGPRPAHLVLPAYPYEEIRTRGEGWVRLGFMVDTHGKPFEITVVDSAGNKDFEKAAVGALRRSTFDPGTVNGQATESGSEFGFKFLEGRRAVGAQPEFLSAYKSFVKAIEAKDKSAAQAALAQLKVTNLYEDAYLGLSHYYYARLWGTDAEQLEGLRRATENEGGEIHYLPTSAYRSALKDCFDLEIKTREYAEALNTWNRLQRLKVDPALEARIAPIVERLETLRSDAREYGVSGVVPEGGSWFLGLFKRHFRIEVGNGYLSQVKLRCDKGYVYFAFDPKLRYEASGKYGGCEMELLGAPGTRFTLFQF